MKIGGAPAEAFSAMRKRALARAGAQVTADKAAPADKTAFLGLAEADLTPAVQGAVKTLLTEIDDLRGEVTRLKARLTEVEALADRDVLTPLLNRRAFVRELHRIGAFSARYGSPAALVYFDLDGFKAVNDRFGHAAGDSALKVVAERLLANTRETDIVGRLGGDEFAVILVQTDLDNAAVQAERLTSGLDVALDVRLLLGQLGRVDLEPLHEGREEPAGHHDQQAPDGHDDDREHPALPPDVHEQEHRGEDRHQDQQLDRRQRGGDAREARDLRVGQALAGGAQDDRGLGPQRIGGDAPAFRRGLDQHPADLGAGEGLAVERDGEAEA
jgi:GGDEF domain-containing protein